MKLMSKLAYYFGLRMRIYPSTKQKQIIKVNSDISRTVYNKMVAIDQELYRLKQVKLPIDTIQARISELESRKNARNMSNHYQYMQDERIDSLTKANEFKTIKSLGRCIVKFIKPARLTFIRKVTGKAIKLIVSMAKINQWICLVGQLDLLTRNTSKYLN